MSAMHAPSVAALLDAIGDPLILLEGGRIAAANAAAVRVFGAQVIGRAVGTLMPDIVADAAPTREPYTLAVSLGTSIGGGGSVRPWTVRVSELGDGRRLLHLIDSSATEAAERMRVDFVANASHELRTPIAAISGFAETLADDEAGGDRATRQHFVGIIAREARRMQRLVEDLMSLSRIEAERYLRPTGIVDLNAIAREAALHAAEQRAPRGADLALKLADERVAVRGDAPQLAQLVHNLVSNGFKYGQAGTPVTLSLVSRDKVACLRVEDEGEGIPATHLPRITQRFYRVNASRSRAVGGTGLGLAIVKHIIERHEGKLEIESVLGQGTTVIVTLPLAPS